MQHVQPAAFGDFLPVLQGQPFFSHRLECVGRVLFSLDPFDLSVLNGVDALFDQLPRLFALIPSFCEADTGVVAKREP
ncbi:hypothetical protein D9M70_579550 [compost metagenome]